MKAEKNDLKLSNTTMNNEFKGKRNKVQIEPYLYQTFFLKSLTHNYIFSV